MLTRARLRGFDSGASDFFGLLQPMMSEQVSRVAVLADVHGNLPALEAVLAEIDRVATDVIVIAGDVMVGPMARECLDVLRDFGSDARWIRGNTDRVTV